MEIAIEILKKYDINASGLTESEILVELDKIIEKNNQIIHDKYLELLNMNND